MWRVAVLAVSLVAIAGAITGISSDAVQLSFPLAALAVLPDAGVAQI